MNNNDEDAIQEKDHTSETLKDFKKAYKEFKKKTKTLKSVEPPLIDWQLYALLSRLGLSKYEILAYVALVKGGPQTISELTGKASKTGIPQPRAYDITGSLIRYGLVEEAKGDTRAKLFRAIPPEEGLSNLLEFFTYAKEEAISILEEERKEGEIYQYGGIWEIKSYKNMINRIKRIIRKAENEILLVSKGNLLKELSNELEQVRKDKNVMISVILPKKGADDVMSMVPWLNYMKIKFKAIYSQPYIIVDRRYAVIWHKKSQESQGARVNRRVIAQEIENPEIILTYIDHFFFSNWKTAKYLSHPDKELERSYPLKLCHIQTALEEIDYLSNIIVEKPEKSKKIPITIKGRLSSTLNPIRIQGTVEKTEFDWNEGKFTLKVQETDKDQSKLWTIGGMLASIEDIIADEITLFAPSEQ